MSRTMHLGCKTCMEQIWIGQNNAFYSGETHTMAALRDFLNRHKTEQEWMTDNFVEHVLTYAPELYGKEWAEVDTETYKAKDSSNE